MFLGYFHRNHATHAEKMLSPPLNETFIHRQTTANQVRFTTVELSKWKPKILNAGNHALEIEKTASMTALKGNSGKARETKLRAPLAEIDLASAWRIWRAVKTGATTVDNSRAFDITGGRHPVVEQALRNQGQTPFIANDCDLARRRARDLVAHRPEHGG